MRITRIGEKRKRDIHDVCAYISDYRSVIYLNEKRYNGGNIFWKKKIIMKKRNGISYIHSFFRLEKISSPGEWILFRILYYFGRAELQQSAQNWNRGISFRASTRLPRPIDFNPKFQRRSTLVLETSYAILCLPKILQFPPWSMWNVIRDTDFSNSQILPNSKIKLLKIKTR